MRRGKQVLMAWSTRPDSTSPPTVQRDAWQHQDRSGGYGPGNRDKRLEIPVQQARGASGDPLSVDRDTRLVTQTRQLQLAGGASGHAPSVDRGAPLVTQARQEQPAGPTQVQQSQLPASGVAQEQPTASGAAQSQLAASGVVQAQQAASGVAPTVEDGLDRAEAQRALSSGPSSIRGSPDWAGARNRGALSRTVSEPKTKTTNFVTLQSFLFSPCCCFCSVCGILLCIFLCVNLWRLHSGAYYNCYYYSAQFPFFKLHNRIHV
ncbi:hypothetical protein VNO78_25990 [Psophocarpus tetragonolobus]|uniref:Uncharacterized protein n=1 Tax=Psophocarpus tetragonolobus TaxID=3891 RepID=A0AAN9XFT9_PSOTE